MRKKGQILATMFRTSQIHNLMTSCRMEQRAVWRGFAQKLRYVSFPCYTRQTNQGQTRRWWPLSGPRH